MKITSIECIPVSIHFVKPIVMSGGAAASAHFLAATEWMGQIEQETIGPLNIYNVPDTITKPITNDLAVKLPLYENGYLYAPDGPGLGVELNEMALPELMTPGKSPIIIK